MSKCSVADCPNTKIKARGLCPKHYGRAYRHGSPHITLVKPPDRGNRTSELQLSLFNGAAPTKYGANFMLENLPNGHFAPPALLPLFPMLTKEQILNRLNRLASQGKIQRVRTGHYHKGLPK